MFKKDGKIKASDDLLFFFSYFCSKFSFWIIYTKKLNENETRKYLSYELLVYCEYMPEGNITLMNDFFNIHNR